MSIDASHHLLQLQASIRVYLTRYPDAADSPEGIRQWWLTQALQTTSIETLRIALTALVMSGEMQLRILPDGTELYARSTQP
jgi:hypothetical protein